MLGVWSNFHLFGFIFTHVLSNVYFVPLMLLFSTRYRISLTLGNFETYLNNSLDKRCLANGYVVILGYFLLAKLFILTTGI